ncbi:AMP-binding protein, partial [Methylobacterium nigriterrae]|uniref:AMP-binding protein n=1 Tax=Methylobacterium nigriterrae TaxID=3127512 RepID=UPI0030141307
PAFALPANRTTRLDAVVRQGSGLSRRRPSIEPGDLAFLQYTGGTTGVAKAAMLTHCNIMANIEQSQLWFEATDPEPGRVMVTALPLY